LRNGQATISLVLLIGGIVSAAVLAIALIAISMIGTGFGADAQLRARAAAMAGIEDGALRLTRNASDAGSYTLTTGSTTASVTITANSPSSGFSTVSSQALISGRRITLAGVYAIDTATGVPTLVSLTQQ
jgi:hypothetical protein